MKKLIYHNEFKPKIKLNKNDLDIEEITLLSTEEAIKLPNRILTTGMRWWLRSPGTYQNNATSVYNDGSVNYYGHAVNRVNVDVRPALRISNLKSYNLKSYDVVKFLDNLWYVISDDMLLSVKAVGNAAFNDNAKKQNANKFEGSDIQKWLQNWLNKKLSVEESKFASEEERVAAMPAANSGAKKIAEQDGYEVYHITTPEASVKYGLLVGGRAKWCISGGYYDGKRDEGVLGEATKYFNMYTNDNFEDIFFVIGHGTKYALCIESYDSLKYQIWNQADVVVREIPELDDLYWDDEA